MTPIDALAQATAFALIGVAVYFIRLGWIWLTKPRD